METLWSILNKVQGMTRSMSWVHRQEMLDDYMGDGNWKKLVWSGMSCYGLIEGYSDGFTTVDLLIIKWAHAIKGVKDTETAYLELTARLDSEWVDDWTEQADNAAIEGGESLNIYGVNVEHGQYTRHQFQEIATNLVLYRTNYGGNSLAAVGK
jgi:hypothetical protein